MKIMSWNINGIRAAHQKGFLDVCKKESPDILCIQEVRAFEHQIPEELSYLKSEYKVIWNAAQKPGYAGTATLVKKHINLLNVNTFDNGHFGDQGRVSEIIIDHNNHKLAIQNAYFPNGNTRANGQEMLTHKLEFYDRFINHICSHKTNGTSVLSAGDFNVAHTEIDLASPKQNKRAVGFLPVEREKLDLMLDRGFTDVLRHFHPDIEGIYSWRSYRKDAKKLNKGWRYDYFFACDKVLPKTKSIDHLKDVNTSDHCPITIKLI